MTKRSKTAHQSPNNPARPAKAAHAGLAARLEDIPNIGASMAHDLRLLGVATPADVREMNPQHAYARLCELTGMRHDPCVIDTFVAAHDFMNGGAARPWWEFTPLRKAGGQERKR